MPKNEYGIKSHYSGMGYMCLHVNQISIFKFITQVCTLHKAMTQQGCFCFPHVVNKKELVDAVDSYDTFQILYSTCFPESLE